MITKLTALFACAVVLLPAAAHKTSDPAPDLFTSIRRGDLRGVRSAIAQHQDVNARDPEGATPLMYAALYFDAACMRLLLDHGAEPNATNAYGATALIWGANDLSKVKLLAGRGADVNARSKLGKTALMVAASRDGAGPIVSYLLSKGARIDLRDELKGVPIIPVGGGGATALIQAAKARDGQALTALVRAGGDISDKEKNANTALLNAVSHNNHSNIGLLLARGADVDAANAGGISPLILAAMRADRRSVGALVQHGAKVEAEDSWGNTALMWAAYSDVPRPELIKLLLEAGADLNHKNKMGETALDWAKRRGETSAVALLQARGATEAGLSKPQSGPVTLSANRSLGVAIERSLPMLQKSGPTVFKQGGCVSCHNNNLPTVAASLARTKGYQVDQPALERERTSLLSLLKPARELLIENGDNIPVLEITGAYSLLALAAQGHAADHTTGALVHNIVNKQNTDGSWSIWAARPPMQYGDIQATALCLRAVQLYALEGRRLEMENIIRKAGKWLARAQPQNTEDHNWKTLGLFWSKADPKALVESAKQLLALQRTDGGWAQLVSLSSDAYATGQSLYALHESGSVKQGDARVQRGVEYLLRTQQADGTWHVKSRSFPFQSYFESGFPYGPDQWISAAGSSWAAIALTLAESTAKAPLAGM